MAAGRIGALAAWLLCLAACAFVISRTSLSTDMTAFLPRAPAPGQEVLVQQLKTGVISRIVLVALQGAPEGKLASLSKGVAATLRTSPEFELVSNGEEAGTEADRAYVWRNRYLLSPAVSAQRFSVEGLRAAFARDLDILGSSAGILVKRTLPNDPTGEILGLVDSLAGEARPQQRDGVWFSRDGRRALILVQTRAPGSDLDGQARALGALQDAFAQARDATGAGTVQLVTSGPGVFAVRSRQQMQEEVSRLSLLASAGVACLLLLAFATIRILPIAFVPVVSGAVAGIAAVDLGFGFVHGITLGFGVTLIGEAVDYAIYLARQTAPGASTRETLPRIWPTLRLGMLTSVVGFGAMLFSSFAGFAQLGLFTIVGLLVALATTRWILPILLARGFGTKWGEAATERLPRLVSRSRVLAPAVAILAAASVALLVAHSRSLWENELASLSPVPKADQELDRDLRHDIGAPDVRHVIIVTAPSREAALGRAEAIGWRLKPLASEGILSGFDSPDRYLPSVAAQRARQQALPDGPDLRANLAAALDGLPFRPDSFGPFVSDVEAAKAQPPLTRESLRGTSLALKLDSALFKQGTAWQALMSLRGVSDPERLERAVSGWNEQGVTLVDLKRESDQLLLLYRSEALHLALFGALAIVALLAVALRSARRLASVIAPLAAAVAVAAAVLVLVDGRLSIFNVFGLLLVVAVGSNYCLFFEVQRLEAPGAGRTIASLVVANLCTVIGFGILAFSKIPVLFGIGSTVAIGTFLSLVFSAACTPYSARAVAKAAPARG
jgi:predicted exporter